VTPVQAGSVDRAALAGDLGRGGYVRGVRGEAAQSGGSWLRTDLVLTRPGILTRCATLLHSELPPRTDRLAARGPAAIALAAAVSLRAGTLLLLGDVDAAGTVTFAGEPFPGARTVLVEDVILTGRHAFASLEPLRAGGLEVTLVLALVDREAGGRAALEATGVPVSTVFREPDLLSTGEAAR
jgi:orotate phosphoribosyltransferase